MNLLDTNVLLRYAEAANPLFATIDAALAALHGAGEVLCVVPQNLYEFWAAATRPVTGNGLGLGISECATELARINRGYWRCGNSWSALTPAMAGFPTMRGWWPP